MHAPKDQLSTTAMKMTMEATMAKTIPVDARLALTPAKIWQENGISPCAIAMTHGQTRIGWVKKNRILFGIDLLSLMRLDIWKGTKAFGKSTRRYQQ